MFIIHEYNIENLAKIILNIAHNKQIYRIPEDSIDEKEQNFNVFEGDLAIDNIYGNECYVYTNIPISIDDIVAELEKRSRDLTSITSEANGEYTCLTKTGIRRYLYIDIIENKDKRNKQKKEILKKGKKRVDEPKLKDIKKGTFIVYLRPFSIDNLPDWIYKQSGKVISDEENLRQMLSIVIDDQKIFGRLPFRCTDTPLSYHLTNAEYMVPYIDLHERFGVRFEVMKQFARRAGFAEYISGNRNHNFNHRKEVLQTTILLNGSAKIGDFKLFRPSFHNTCYRRDKHNPPIGYENIDSCIICATPLYGPYYAVLPGASDSFIPLCVLCGECDLEGVLTEISNADTIVISNYPKTFDDIVQLIPRFPYIPDHIFENYKRTLMWLFSQPSIVINDERIMLTNDFLKLIRPEEVMIQLRLANQERKFIVPIVINQ